MRRKFHSTQQQKSRKTKELFFKSETGFQRIPSAMHMIGWILKRRKLLKMSFEEISYLTKSGFQLQKQI
jgi:hypothetical protein